MWSYVLCCILIIVIFICFFLLQEIQATWYEKLHEWEDALVAYDKKIDMNKEDPELILGRMRCLEALGEWYVHAHKDTQQYEHPSSVLHASKGFIPPDFCNRAYSQEKVLHFVIMRMRQTSVYVYAFQGCAFNSACTLAYT